MVAHGQVLSATMVLDYYAGLARDFPFEELVPPPRWFEPDPAVLGAPFLVMSRVDGDAPADNPPYPIEG